MLGFSTRWGRLAVASLGLVLLAAFSTTGDGRGQVSGEAALEASPMAFTDLDFSFRVPKGWGQRRATPTNVEFAGPFSGTVSPRLQVERYGDPFYVSEEADALREAFLKDLATEHGSKAEVFSSTVTLERGRRVLIVDAGIRAKGTLCRSLAFFVSGAQWGYRVTYFDTDKGFQQNEAMIRAALSSFDTTGTFEPASFGLYGALVVLLAVGIGAGWAFGRKKERRGRPEEETINLRDMKGQALPILDIEEPGRLAARRPRKPPS